MKGSAIRSPGWKLRTYFTLLVAVFAIGAVTAATYVFMQSERDGRRDAERDARFAAKTGADQLGSAIALVRATAEQVAASPGIDGTFVKPEACTLSFQGAGGIDKGHLDIVRADGGVFCSSRGKPGEKVSGYAGAPWLAQAVAGKQLLAPVQDAATGRQAIVATAPIPGGTIAAFIELAPVGPTLLRLYGQGKPVEFLITSRDGATVLARSIQPEKWVGRKVAGTDFNKAAGHVERPDVDGTTRLYQSAAVPGVGWRFYAGEDKAAALTSSGRLRNRQAIIILAGLALALAAALLAYRRVALPVARLGSAVRSASDGATREPVAVSGPAEVAALGEDVNGLIASVNRELAERRRAEHNYRLLFESSPLPMWIHDSQTCDFLAVNAAAVETYGYSTDELLALKTSDVELPECDPDAATVRHHAKDGTPVDVRTSGHDVRFADRPARFVLAEDVGERERLGAQLSQSQKMEAIGRLAGGVAHDFNNLLTAIIGYSDLLLTDMPPGDPRRGEVQEIMKAGERAVALTRQLLTFSRGQIVEPTVFEVNEAVADLEPLLRRLIREDITIQTQIGADAGRIRADRGQFEQILVNLAVNARDAMPEGGTLLIATSTVEIDAEYLRMHAAAGSKPGLHSVLEVSDTGVGMDDEVLSHVFEPFFSTKEEGRGTGLGLATVYGIVRQSGGFLWAYSDPGQGTSFKVYLPVATAPADAKAPVRPEVTLAGGGRTVLLAEDDPAVRAVVRRMLEARQFEVLEATQGDEAMALSDAGMRDSFTFLVTDTIMPGPGGLELAAGVRARHPAVRTVIMSGYSETLATGAAVFGQGTEFIAKPFSAADLYSKLDALLGSPN